MAENLSNQTIETKKASLTKRLTTGTAIGLLALYSLMAGGVYLLIVAFIMIYFSISEYHKILMNKGFFPSLTLMHAASIIFIILFFLKCYSVLPFVITVAIITSFLVVLFKGRQPYIANVATTALGLMYGGWLPCHIILISQLYTTDVTFFSVQINEASALVVTIFLSIVATDVGGFFFGSKYGKHKLAPIISPKKTIEGALGGAISSVVISLIGGLLNTQLTVIQCIILGLVITISAQLGDLSESLIKRDAGVKDSSDVLPGHGGFLDRVDSYMFALPAAYYYVAYFTHGNNAILNGIQYIKGLFGG